jgi:peptidoglycan/LPS O-acetylase OafA/YrhL
VALFFGLSGFLLYWPFAGAIVRAHRGPRATRYLRNRALRILPAYWVILAIAALVLDTVLRPGGSVGTLTDPLLLLESMLFVQNYDPDQVVTGIGPAWSLNVEVVFYLLLPLLAWAAIALARRTSRVAAALAPAAFLLLVGLAGKAIAAWVVPPARPFDGWENDWHSVIERSFLGQADLFAFGMALAVVRVLWEDGRLQLPRRWRGTTLVGALAALAVVVTTFTDDGVQMSYSPWNTVVALDLALLLAVVVLPAREPGHHAGGAVRTLEWRPLVLAGVVSYSVFLWHEPLIRWLADHDLTFEGRTGFVVTLALTASVTFALSAATYRWVEAPSLRLKRRSTTAAQEEAAAAVGELSAAP